MATFEYPSNLEALRFVFPMVLHLPVMVSFILKVILSSYDRKIVDDHTLPHQYFTDSCIRLNSNKIAIKC